MIGSGAGYRGYFRTPDKDWTEPMSESVEMSLSDALRMLAERGGAIHFGHDDGPLTVVVGCPRRDRPDAIVSSVKRLSRPEIESLLGNDWLDRAIIEAIAECCGGSQP